MGKTTEPSIKAKRFLEEYVRNGFNATQAYQAIYPNASYETARVRSCKLLKDEKCVKYLREYIEQC